MSGVGRGPAMRWPRRDYQQTAFEALSWRGLGGVHEHIWCAQIWGA